MEKFVTLSERGKPVLVVNSVKFTKHKVLTSGEICWRCADRSCKAKVYTVGSENLISRSEIEHNHEKNIKKLNRQIISASVKRKAVEDICEKPSKIIHSSLKEHTRELDTITVKDIHNIRNNIYNSRRKTLPALPKNRAAVIAALKSMTIRTIKDENFAFIIDDVEEIVVFSCLTNLTALSKSEKLYVDGTFSYCADHFLQLFTLHVLEKGYYIPLAFCLLPNKQECSYKYLFDALRNKCNSFGLDLNPKVIVADFEIAIHNAVRTVFPNSRVIGCRFHLAQAWFRKIQNLGLVPDYKDENSTIGKWLRYVFGLPFLDPSEVGNSFAFDFAEIQPQDERVSRFADYLVDNYINEEAVFPPSLWSELSDSLERSTNACESFHAKFNASFYSNHPTIFTFIETLKQFQTDTYIKIQSLHETSRIRDPAVRRRKQCIGSQIEKYKNGYTSRFDFVKCISYFYKR